MFKKNINKTYFIWALPVCLYAIFMFTFSFLRPYGLDEFKYLPYSIKGIFDNYLIGYFNENSRIGLLINDALLYAGRPWFLGLNTLLQTLIPFGLYYMVFLRLPEFKILKDFYTFGFIALCCIFAVAQPDNTLLWIGGACNYSWVFLAFVIYIIFLRLHAEKKYILPPSYTINIISFFGGILLGMSNENNAPMALCLSILFVAYCLFRRIKIPTWFYYTGAGIICGLIFLFSAPGPYKRLDYWVFADFKQSGILKKIFIHLSRMNDFVAITLFMPILSALALVLSAADKDKPAPVIKNKYFIYAVLFWSVSFTLAFVLFNAPSPSLRVFYSASLFMLAAFVFTLEFLKQAYGLNFYKYLFIAMLLYAIYVTPCFTVPYVNLYRQNAERETKIAQAKKEGKTILYAQKFFVLKGINENLQIEYYDFLNYQSQAAIKHFYGIDLKDINIDRTISPSTKNI